MQLVVKVSNDKQASLYYQGDSGGPTNCLHMGKWTVAGVASWVRGCHNAPTVYTSTAWYLDWVQDQIDWYEDRMACGTKPPQTPWQGTKTAHESDSDNQVRPRFTQTTSCRSNK